MVRDEQPGEIIRGHADVVIRRIQIKDKIAIVNDARTGQASPEGKPNAMAACVALRGEIKRANVDLLRRRTVAYDQVGVPGPRAFAGVAVTIIRA